jgi:pseudoazurin
VRQSLKKVLFLSVLLVATSATANAANIKVAMLNTGAGGAQMVFEPDFIEAKVGDTVEFVVTDVLHQPVSVSVPKGQKGWRTEPSEGIKVKVTKAGVIFFKCETHSILGMAGIIQVGGSKDNLEEAQEAVEEYLEEAAMNKERLPAALAKLK